MACRRKVANLASIDGLLFTFSLLNYRQTDAVLFVQTLMQSPSPAPAGLRDFFLLESHSPSPSLLAGIIFSSVPDFFCSSSDLRNRKIAM